MTISREDYDRLVEIQSEMNDLLEEARNLVRQADKQVYDRAQAYAFGWIESGVDSWNKYDYDFKKVLRELEPDKDEGDEDCEEEEDDNGDEA